MRLPSFDIRSKLTGLAFALVGVVVCALTLRFSASQAETLDRRLQAKAMTYAHLLARQSESAIAFNDAETAREVFAAASAEADLSAVALYKETGALLGGLGEHVIPPEATTDAVVRRKPTIIGVVVPVVSKEGPRGMLVVELSTSAIDRESARSRRSALIAGGITLALGLVASWLIGGAFANRVRRIQRATQAFARGQLDQPPIEDESKDEIGELGRAFNTMSVRMNHLIECLETDGREEAARLERVVNERTAELRQKNEDLAFFLQHLDQGFMTVDHRGGLAPERSAILEKWFGVTDNATKLWDYIAPRDPQAAAWLATSWESIFDGYLPPELAIDQMPKELHSDDLTLGLRYQAVSNESGDVDKVIMVITDISDELARQRAEAIQKELATVCARIVADPRSVELFVAEGGVIIDALRTAHDTGATLVEQQRWLHTLKGNAAFVGLVRLAEQCHALETHVIETGEAPTASARTAVEALWQELCATIVPLLSGTHRDEIAIRRTALLEHVEAIRAGKPRQALASAAEQWFLEEASERLERAAEQARSVAHRLEKENVEITVEDRGVRLEAEAWGPFWAAFVHVVCNAVDHGIEDEATRLAANKPPSGTIVLRAVQTATEDIIEIADDGAGVDWAALRQRAARLGLETNPTATPVELLFVDGVSTKSEVSETSGRGVGLGACRAACEAMGGHVEVVSTRGLGTRFSFRVPRREVQSTESIAPASAVAA